ncbi:MAG: GTPase HflX [Alphaproteobacteria bacterium]|nr:GTPase HflX [Alphaproteobacteria bacterium]
MASSGRAFVLHPVLPAKFNQHVRSLPDILDEAGGLARAIHLDVLVLEAVRVTRISPATLLGSGAVESIAERIAELKPTLVIINATLSPIQQRNLENAWKVKVIDRTGLILAIFGERAQTKEGRIQVDLAALEYQKSRIVRAWTHLERQRGGLGKTGGPGEKQMELDRRRIDGFILSLKRQLEEVRKTRELGRKSRERVPFPIVALVGYTNAGKSTLFNRLTGAGVFAEDMPFATLDPTLRALKLPSGNKIILSDTVGFISHLPTHLIAAFRATLEQVQYADVILHVRDVSRPDHHAQRQDVMDVMKDLGVNIEQDERIFEVLNKIDLCPPEDQAEYTRLSRLDLKTIPVSAVTGQGMDVLLSAIDTFLLRHHRTAHFRLKIEDGQALSWLYRHGDVIDRTDHKKTIDVSVLLDEKNKGQFERHFGYKDRHEH